MRTDQINCTTTLFSQTGILLTGLVIKVTSRTRSIESVPRKLALKSENAKIVVQRKKTESCFQLFKRQNKKRCFFET